MQQEPMYTWDKAAPTCCPNKWTAQGQFPVTTQGHSQGYHLPAGPQAYLVTNQAPVHTAKHCGALYTWVCTAIVTEAGLKITNRLRYRAGRGGG